LVSIFLSVIERAHDERVRRRDHSCPGVYAIGLRHAALLDLGQQYDGVRQAGHGIRWSTLIAPGAPATR
jgi:hypothetical protein